MNIAINRIDVKHAGRYLRENGKRILHLVFAIVILVMALWFVGHEKAEVSQVRQVLATGDTRWVLAGIALTGVYVFMHGLFYRASFRAIGAKVGIMPLVDLFLKRNFVSVFLPAGGVSSLAFFSSSIQRRGLSRTQVQFASSIFGAIGIFTVILVALPAFVFALAVGRSGVEEWVALFAVGLLTGGLFYGYLSIRKKGRAYRWLSGKFPSLEAFLQEVASNNTNRRQLVYAVIFSLVIEVLGMAHLYIALLALHLQPTLLMAVMGYVVSVVFMMISPFLKGVGAVELSMTLLLRSFGLSPVEAVSVTLLYRFFEFWLPLLAGAASFVAMAKTVLLRVLPAVLLFALGAVNLVSVLTPAIAERLARVKEVLPIGLIDASNDFVFAAGLFLLLTAAFMLKGSRTAWYFAIALSVGSLFGHLTKAIDYEEAGIALVVIMALVASRKQYYVKHDPRLGSIGLQTSALAVAATLVYGVIGFYFLDKTYFGIDFSLRQSVLYTLRYFFQWGGDLVTTHSFARHFLYSIRISGAGSLLFLLYTLIRPYAWKPEPVATDFERANLLVKRYGKSSLDYFKTYRDKLLFFTDDQEAFLAYRVTGTFAVVLENPVAASEEDMARCIRAFDRFCYRSGLKSIYYRVSDDNARIYHAMGKRKLFLGQEGTVDLSTFTMEGGSRKSMRNSIKKVTDKGYTAHIYQPPLKDGLMQRLRQVSDEWLKDTGRSEIVFSQGMFIEEELKAHTVITVENAEDKVVAFLNIVPDHAKGEATYDLIRKTADAPSGVIDFLVVELFFYLKSQHYPLVNLGLAPLSGLEEPAGLPEKSIKFAYEKIKAFSHYKGLRDFKDKFNPLWQNQYLIYDQDFDLIEVPKVLAQVIKPGFAVAGRNISSN